jgi:Transposase, Mutator family
MTELKNRGVEDILIAVVDGLKGFPEAIAAVFPPTIVQTSIVHLIRNSMDFASWKDRKPIAAELKAIYRATDTDVARRALEDFDAGMTRGITRSSVRACRIRRGRQHFSATGKPRLHSWSPTSAYPDGSLGLHPVKHEVWRILHCRIALMPVMGSKPSATTAICPGFG